VSASEKDEGLHEKYSLTRLEDPQGKHADCRYFVLDPKHDLIARYALATYAEEAERQGYAPLAAELHEWMDSLNTETKD
jgi:hypothetical protein